MHSALELLGGLALLAGPFLLGAGPAALVASFSIGAVVVGLALAGPDSLPIGARRGPRARGCGRVRAHADHARGRTLSVRPAGATRALSLYTRRLVAPSSFFTR